MNAEEMIERQKEVYNQLSQNLRLTEKGARDLDMFFAKLNILGKDYITKRANDIYFTGNYDNCNDDISVKEMVCRYASILEFKKLIGKTPSRKLSHLDLNNVTDPIDLICMLMLTKKSTPQWDFLLEHIEDIRRSFRKGLSAMKIADLMYTLYKKEISHTTVNEFLNAYIREEEVS